MKEHSVTDTVAVIVGASSGMGAATARRFVAAGAKVMLAARRSEELNRLSAELGPGAVYAATDVQKLYDVERLIERTVATLGRIDHLLYIAGTKYRSAGWKSCPQRPGR